MTAAGALANEGGTAPGGSLKTIAAGAAAGGAATGAAAAVGAVHGAGCGDAGAGAPTVRLPPEAAAMRPCEMRSRSFSVASSGGCCSSFNKVSRQRSYCFSAAARCPASACRNISRRCADSSRGSIARKRPAVADGELQLPALLPDRDEPIEHPNALLPERLLLIHLPLLEAGAVAEGKAERSPPGTGLPRRRDGRGTSAGRPPDPRPRPLPRAAAIRGHRPTGPVHRRAACLPGPPRATVRRWRRGGGTGTGGHR